MLLQWHGETFVMLLPRGGSEAGHLSCSRFQARLSLVTISRPRTHAGHGRRKGTMMNDLFIFVDEDLRRNVQSSWRSSIYNRVVIRFEVGNRLGFDRCEQVCNLECDGMHTQKFTDGYKCGTIPRRRNVGTYALSATYVAFAP